jgi:hypothetical protein
MRQVEIINQQAPKILNVLKLIVTLSSTFAFAAFIASTSTSSSDPPIVSQKSFALHDSHAADLVHLTHAVEELTFITIPSAVAKISAFF